MRFGALLGTFASCVLVSMSARANDELGFWGPTIDWPLVPIHAALMPDGKLMTFGTSNTGVQGGELHYDVWDPALGTGPESHLELPNLSRTDIFCAAQVLLPNSGKVVLFGGDNSVPGTNWGNPNTAIFDGNIQVLSDAGFAMSFPRWYATATTLPNGETLVEGGSNNGVAGSGMLTPEIFNQSKGFRSLFGATSEFAYGNDFNRWWYPRSFVMPDGRIFGVTGPAMYFLEPAGDGKLTNAGTFEGSNRGATSTAAMYSPGRILQVGGAWHSTETHPVLRLGVLQRRSSM